MLQLDIQQKIVPISDNNLINCYVGNGPFFGGTSGGINADLGILDECNNKACTCAFPSEYKWE
jgi:hypothetical protein